MKRFTLFFLLAGASVAEATVKPPPEETAATFPSLFERALREPHTSELSREGQAKLVKEILANMRSILKSVASYDELVQSLLSAIHERLLPDPTVDKQQKELAEKMETVAANLLELFGLHVIIGVLQVTEPDLLAQLDLEGTPLVESAGKAFETLLAKIAAYQEKAGLLKKPAPPPSKSPAHPNPKRKKPA